MLKNIQPYLLNSYQHRRVRSLLNVTWKHKIAEVITAVFSQKIRVGHGMCVKKRTNHENLFNGTFISNEKIIEKKSWHLLTSVDLLKIHRWIIYYIQICCCKLCHKKCNLIQYSGGEPGHKIIVNSHKMVDLCIKGFALEVVRLLERIVWYGGMHVHFTYTCTLSF